MRIEGARVTPAEVSPGSTANLEATYTVMPSSSDTQVNITESREVTLNGELVGNPEVNVTDYSGTYQTTVPLILHSDTKKGTYRVITTIKTESGKSSSETSFTMQ